jgi:hypothetical protein
MIGKRDVVNLCSIRATRRILRCHWHWDIPESTVKESKKFFNQILNVLAEGIISNHVSNNERLKKYHLRPRLRLSLNKNFLEDLYKRVADINMGSTGEMNSNTVVSDKQEIEVT